MHIKNGRLYDDSGKPVRFVRANAHGGPMTPRFIVAHDTAGATRKFSSVQWFASRSCPTSAHFVIERDGTITQCVETNKRAWHAGESAWKDIRFLNSCSVGIEIVNPGILRRKDDACQLVYRVSGRESIVETFPAADCRHLVTAEHGDGYWLPYTQDQIAAFTAIARALAEEYAECNEIVTHWEISPRRKIDTGPQFPLAEVRKAVFDPDPPVADDPVAPMVAAAQVATSAKPSLLKEATRSKSVRYLGGAIVAWVEAKLGFLKSVLPEANKDATEIVDPLTSLGGLLKVNISSIAFAVVLVTLLVVIARHTRDKVELAKLKGE